MPSLRRLAATAALAALTVASAAGCGGDSAPAAPAAQESTPVERDLTGYDAFVLASAQNNRLFADVYAVRFSPFAVERITVDKRVSSLAADSDRVVVAAADQDVDRLAEVSGSGTLGPIPGLDRPFAYTPSLRDGVMYYYDAQGEEKGKKFQYFAWDLERKRKTLTFASAVSLGAAQPLGADRFLVSTADGKDLDQVAVRAPSGKLKTYPVNGLISELSPGRRHFAVTVLPAGASFGDTPEALVLIDRETGTTARIAGLQGIAWNPAGTRLLARRTASPTDSPLVLIDPAKPNAPVDVANVPGLTIYSGAWVRGEAVATS
ncbi:MAG: hypothetical protein ACT4QF_18955 [Sporichthyaceae bacterium]